MAQRGVIRAAAGEQGLAGGPRSLDVVREITRRVAQDLAVGERRQQRQRDHRGEGQAPGGGGQEVAGGAHGAGYPGAGPYQAIRSWVAALTER